MTKFVIRPSRAIGSQSLDNVASGLVVATLIILFLYVGREILEPLVIAALLSFILVPLVRWLRSWGVWRVPSVILTVLFAIALIATLARPIVLSSGAARRRLASTRPICAPRYERWAEER